MSLRFSYTLVFAYYGLALVTLLLFRPIFTWKFRRYKSCRVPVYFEMYSIPVLVIVHAGLAGLLCKSAHPCYRYLLWYIRRFCLSLSDSIGYDVLDGALHE